jgi:hypothetical protein
VVCEMFVLPFLKVNIAGVHPEMGFPAGISIEADGVVSITTTPVITQAPVVKVTTKVSTAAA